MPIKQSRVYDRSIELAGFIEHKYLLILEDIVAREAEILSKPVKTQKDLLLLVGFKAMKKHIAEELGLNYHEDEYVEDLLDEIEALTNTVEPVESEA
ncbi:hypothetical protein [Staphylothermus hellenicus]|uniref:Uncharacterized protein n=1 Tax=Staphylothermus hellenicus (strain DSM 12710 / JCM 10830 / BK20S6-10-b1 / P8) TaxID=591019 RepID=D7D8F6_STAHD|nr:hypothetical protein [Staphylothermus hellenicus]ADI32052.1 hypothetical protein Shell_0946 [Staphylothermus hellenicus DSM 12710]